VVTEACRKNGRKVFSWFSWRMEELRKTHEGGFTLIELMAVITLLFHKQRYHSQTRPN
jgi:Prokaryotic N-terminal methylation motif